MELSLHGPPYIPVGGGSRVGVLITVVVVENAATPTNPDVAVGSSNSSNCHPGTVAVASSSPTSILQCVIVALRCRYRSTGFTSFLIVAVGEKTTY